MLGEGGDALDVDLDGAGREVAELHVLDHSLAQRCHGVLLGWDEGDGGALIMAQRERGIGTEAGKTADEKSEAVREGSEEGTASARPGSGGLDLLPRSGLVQ